MTILLFSAAISTALVAGIFFAFSSFVMGALARLKPREGIEAMQSINVVVLNPWFFGAFFGAGILCVASVLVVLLTEVELGRSAVLCGAALYLVGCIGVTAGGNVPLNDRLAKVDPEDAQSAVLWDDYVTRWTRWNHLRTAASLAAAVAFAIALSAG